MHVLCAPFCQLNLWMGCAGVTAHLHYDAMENFYTQIQGQKTFLLFSPAYSNCLGLRPQAHPSYRQVHGVDLAVMSDSEVSVHRISACALPGLPCSPISQFCSTLF